MMIIYTQYFKNKNPSPDQLLEKMEQFNKITSIAESF